MVLARVQLQINRHAGVFRGIVHPDRSPVVHANVTGAMNKQGRRESGMDVGDRAGSPERAFGYPVREKFSKAFPGFRGGGAHVADRVDADSC